LSMENIEDILAGITAMDGKTYEEAAQRQKRLTKPEGSLGRLEEIACRICGIKRSTRPKVSPKRIVLFAADHGVTAEGVSAYPGDVTAQMVHNIVRGGAAINAIASSCGAQVEVVDIGVDADLRNLEGIVHDKIARGTSNMKNGPAMSIDRATRAITAGIGRARAAVEDGVELLGTGEMGIGNTTPAAALYAVLLDMPPSEVTGRGAGLKESGVLHKTRIVEEAIEANKDRIGDPLSALASLGGLEIAGLCGLILGAARLRIPVVVDGYISSAAALVAVRMKKTVREYCFFGHLSAEKGHGALMERLGEKPLLDLGMRLGEGTGAALAMTVIDAAVEAHNRMATFESAGVSGKEDRN